MPKDQPEEEPKPKLLGLDMLLNMTDLDRAQAVWERAMHPETHDFMTKLAEYNAGVGPHPGMYEGPVVDFIKARRELDQEKPERHDE